MRTPNVREEGQGSPSVGLEVPENQRAMPGGKKPPVQCGPGQRPENTAEYAGRIAKSIFTNPLGFFTKKVKDQQCVKK
jgi:hypothetical protein